MAKQSLVDEALALLSKVGVEGRIARNHKHVVLHWEVEDQKFSYTVAKTPQDCRARLNCLAGIKRKLKQAGLNW